METKPKYRVELENGQYYLTHNRQDAMIRAYRNHRDILVEVVNTETGEKENFFWRSRP